MFFRINTIFIICIISIAFSAIFQATAAEDTWTRKADMPTARSSLCNQSKVVNGKIYVVGGNKGAMELTTVEEYNPKTDKWTKKADMSTPRENFHTSAVNGKIYAIGGWNDVNKTLSTVEEYDPATDKWTKKADMPSPTWGHSTSVVNDKIYVVGGGFGRSTVEEYDTGFTGKSIDPKGKLTTSWGKLKAKH